MVTNCSATAVFHTDGFLILLETINYAAVNFDWEEEKAELITTDMLYLWVVYSRKLFVDLLSYHDSS